MFHFKVAVPEEVGIPSDAVLSALARMEEQGIEVHSFSLVRHDKVCAEGYWYPYHAGVRQLMYSSTKSVTAVAIGFAVQEGLVRLDETLEEIFDSGEMIHPTMRSVTVEHLLTMSCGHETEINVYQPGWIAAFLNYSALHTPGEHFFYNTAGVDLLCAILYRRSGEQFTKFLESRLFRPLGMAEDICCGFLPDGTEIGGGGLFWHTEDYKRFTRFLLHKGEWEGKQLLDRTFMEKAVTPIIQADDSSDYGYLIWIDRATGNYSSRGMLGQFGICIPEKDAFVVVTAQASTVKGAPNHADQIMDILNQELIPRIGEEALPASPDADRLAEVLKKAKLPSLPVGYAPLEEKVNGRIYRPEETMTPGILMEYFFGDGSQEFFLELRSVRFEFSRPELQVVLELPEGEHVLRVGLGGRFVVGTLFGETTAACGRWRSAGTLELEVRLLERIMGSRFLLTFREENGTMEVRADSMELNNYRKEANNSSNRIFRM